MPPQTTVADTSGLTIRALLICTRVIVTHKKDARSAEKPMPLTQFGAFQAAMKYAYKKDGKYGHRARTAHKEIVHKIIVCVKYFCSFHFDVVLIVLNLSIVEFHGAKVFRYVEKSEFKSD